MFPVQQVSPLPRFLRAPARHGGAHLLQEELRTWLHLAPPADYQEAVRASKQELEVQSVESRARASGKNRTTAALEARMNADPVVSNVHTEILR